MVILNGLKTVNVNITYPVLTLSKFLTIIKLLLKMMEKVSVHAHTIATLLDTFWYLLKKGNQI